jgi:hypothetical protein
MEVSTALYMILGMLTVASIYTIARCAEMARLVRREKPVFAPVSPRQTDH